ncbi:unnamed protein product [Peniophora sp. CBMAI 1063]|nr:unnamed protein product [Peniophora sp. CBMAI 1063]
MPSFFEKVGRLSDEALNRGDISVLAACSSLRWAIIIAMGKTDGHALMPGEPGFVASRRLGLLLKICQRVPGLRLLEVSLRDHTDLDAFLEDPDNDPRLELSSRNALTLLHAAHRCGWPDGWQQPDATYLPKGTPSMWDWHKSFGGKRSGPRDAGSQYLRDLFNDDLVKLSMQAGPGLTVTHNAHLDPLVLTALRDLALVADPQAAFTPDDGGAENGGAHDEGAQHDVAQDRARNGGAQDGGDQNNGAQNGGAQNGGALDDGALDGRAENDGVQDDSIQDGDALNQSALNGGAESDSAHDDGAQYSGALNGSAQNGGAQDGGSLNGGPRNRCAQTESTQNGGALHGSSLNSASAEDSAMGATQNFDPPLPSDSPNSIRYHTDVGDVPFAKDVVGSHVTLGAQSTECEAGLEDERGNGIGIDLPGAEPGRSASSQISASSATHATVEANALSPSVAAVAGDGVDLPGAEPGTSANSQIFTSRATQAAAVAAQDAQRSG